MLDLVHQYFVARHFMYRYLCTVTCVPLLAVARCTWRTAVYEPEHLTCHRLSGLLHLVRRQCVARCIWCESTLWDLKQRCSLPRNWTWCLAAQAFIKALLDLMELRCRATACSPVEHRAAKVC